MTFEKEISERDWLDRPLTLQDVDDLEREINLQSDSCWRAASIELWRIILGHLRNLVRLEERDRVAGELARPSGPDELTKALEGVGLVEDYIAAWESEAGTEECLGYIALKRRELFAAWRRNYEEGR